MASKALRVQKVSEPIVRSVELREMYDHSLNDLEETWNDLGKLKSTLRSIGHRVDDAVDLRAPASSATARHTMPITVKQLGEPLENLPHNRPRKVCRLDERNVDRDVNSPTNVPLRAPAPNRHVAFKTSEVHTGSDRESWHRDVPLDHDSKSSLTINLTDSRAERETQVRFLNDSVSPASQVAASGSGGSTEPDMVPWVRRVNVRVPKAPSPRDAAKEGDRAQSGFDIHSKRPTVKDATEGYMNKLQETIRLQRAKGSLASSNGSGEAHFTNHAAAADSAHFANGMGYGAKLARPSANDDVKPRKVASLPAAKAYPGFSHPHQASAASAKQAAARAASSKQPDAAAAKAKTGTAVSSPRSVAERNPVVGGFKASPSSAPAAKHSKITTSSWRAGLRLVRQELGQAAQPPADLQPTAQCARDRSDRSKASPLRRPLSAPAASHKKDAQLLPPALSSATSQTAVRRKQTTDTGMGKRAATPQAASPAPATTAGAGGQIAATVGMHKATISDLVDGVASGSVTLPDAAKDVLRELQSEVGEETSSHPRKAAWESVEQKSADRSRAERQHRMGMAVATVAGQSSSKDRGQTGQARPAASTPPLPKTRRYDAADIQKYMQRKKSEERRQRAAEVASKKRAEEEHQRKLQELFMKQKGVHRPGSVSGRPHVAPVALPLSSAAAGLMVSTAIAATAVNNDTFTHDPHSSVHRVAVVDSDKENRGMGSGGTPTSSSGPPSSRDTPDHCLAAHGFAPSYESAASLLLRAPPSMEVEAAAVWAPTRDDGGLLSFADENLRRILNKYKTRRELEARLPFAGAVQPLQQQQQQQRTGQRVADSAEPLDAAARSHVERIASIKAATSLLAAKIHAAQAKLTEPGLSGQHESPRSTRSPVLDGGQAAARARSASYGDTGSPLFFARTSPGAGRLPSRDIGACSWPYGGSTGRRESESKHERLDALRRTESVTSSSDDDRSQTLDSSGAYEDLALSGRAVGTRAELRHTGDSAADSAASFATNQAVGSIADRIAKSFGQTEFCLAPRRGGAEDSPNSIRLRLQAPLSTEAYFVPQRAAQGGGTALRSATGVQQDFVHRTPSNSPPKPNADYYSSINVHLRKSLMDERDVAKQAATAATKMSSSHQVLASAVTAALPPAAAASEAASLSSWRARGDSSASLLKGDGALAPLERAPSPERKNGAALMADVAAAATPTGWSAAASSGGDLRGTHGSSPVLGRPGMHPSDAFDGRRERNAVAAVGGDSSSSADSSPRGGQSSGPGAGSVPVPPTGAHSFAPRLAPDAVGAAATAESGVATSHLSASAAAQSRSRLLGADAAAAPATYSSPLGLGFRMVAELNLLDSVEASVRALGDVEMTRHAAAAQQEAARLALLLEGAKHSHEHELRQLRARVRAEEEEAQRQLEAVRRQALAATLERDAAAEERRRADSQSLALYDSTRRLVESQTDATRASIEATRHLAEAAALAGRDENMRRREAAQIAAEAASLSAAAAVTEVLDRQRQEQAEFFRLARQHVYDRSVQVSAPLTTGDDRVDARYATSFDSPSRSSVEPSASRVHDSDGTLNNAKASPDMPPSRTHTSQGSIDSSSTSDTSNAYIADNQSPATVVESDDVHTANVSTESAISSESDVVAAGGRRQPLEQSYSEQSLKKVAARGHRHSNSITVSENSVSTASSLADEVDRGRGGTASRREHSASTIGTDSNLGARRSLLKSGTDLSASGSAVRTLSDVQAIVQRQAASDVAKRHASSSTASASILTTEAVRLHDRQTANEQPPFPRDVRPGLADGDCSTATSDGSTIRSESGAYASRKVATPRDAGNEDDYTQDFYETSNASADESGADVPACDSKRRVDAMHTGGPAEPDKQRSPRMQKLAAHGEGVLPSTSADDTGRSRAAAAAVGHGGPTVAHGGRSSTSHALAVIRQLIRDEKLRALHEEQLARARYRAISYKSKFELQTVATQKEIADLKGNAELLTELEARAAALADSFARKKAVVQSKLRSDRTYYNSRLDNLRERYMELAAAAAKDHGAGVTAQLAEIDTPLDDVDLSLSESSISSSAGELNADSIATPVGRERQEDARYSSNAASCTGVLNSSTANVGKAKWTHREWQDGTTLGDGHGHRPTPVQVPDEESLNGSSIMTRDMPGTGTAASPPTLDGSQVLSSLSQAASSAQAAGAGAISKVSDGTTATRAAGQATRRRLLGQQPGTATLGAAKSKPAARFVPHGDSESDESISMSVLEGGTGSESDTEGRIQALQYQLKQKQKEEARLKRLLTDAERERRRERKRNQETSLHKQLELTEENIARLNENLREVQRSAQPSAHPEDGDDNVAIPQLQPLRPGSSGNMMSTSAHEPAAQVTASVTKPLIKQPRAALQQLSAAAVGPAAGSAVVGAVTAPVFVETVPSSPDLTLGIQAIPDDLTRSLSIIDHEARVLAPSSPGVQPEAVITVARSGDIRPAEQDLEIDGVRSVKVNLSSYDRGDSQALKGYASDSFVDSYTSEEQGENDDSKSESVPEEIPEVLEEDTSEHSIVRLYTEVGSEALSHPGTGAITKEHTLKPEPFVTASADPATELQSPREVGGVSSLADTIDSMGGYSNEPFSPRHFIPSESSSTTEDDEGSARVSPPPTAHPLSDRGTQLDQVATQPLATRLLATRHELVVDRDVSAVSNQLPKSASVERQSVSSESSIAEDFPSSVSVASESVRNQEASGSVGIQYGVKLVDSVVDLPRDSVEHITDQPVSPASGAQFSSLLAETGGDHSPAPASMLPLVGTHRSTSEDGYDEEHVTDEYEIEQFDSDPSVASGALPSERVGSLLEAGALLLAGSPLEARSEVLLLENKPAGAALSVTADAAAIPRVVAEEISAQNVVNHDWPQAATHASDDDASEKDALWSASDEGKQQSPNDAASASGKRGNEGESVEARGGAVVVAELSHESSISESIEEVVEQTTSSEDAEIGGKGLPMPAAGTESAAASRSRSPAVLLAEAEWPESIVAIPSVVGSAEMASSAPFDESQATVVDRLADWLLKEALQAYGCAREAKLNAAGKLAAAATAAAMKIAGGERAQATVDAVASSARATDSKVAHPASVPAPTGQAPVSASPSAEKEAPQGLAKAAKSASAVSLADLPPLVAKKTPAAFEPMAVVLASSASTAAAAVASLPPAMPEAASAGEAKSLRPVSPALGSSGAAGPSSDPDDAWTKLDKEINSVFGDDVDWFDEDFGLGVSKKPSPSAPASPGKKPVVSPQQPPPPPYPGASEVARQAGRGDLKGVPPPASVSVIPDKQEDILTLAFSAVDTFWQMRRFGESWDGAQPPEDYMASATGAAAGLEAASKASHSKMVFDLVGEMLREIYREETDAEVQESWPTSRRPKLPSRRYWKGKTPPATIDELKKVVEQHIFKIIGCQPQVKNAAVGPRARKKDRVDGILIEELRQEEADWVNYAEDEDAVKEAVFKDIFNLLIVDTGKHISEAMRTTKRYSE